VTKPNITVGDFGTVTRKPVIVYKRCNDQYEALQRTMALSEIEQRPIVLPTG